MRLDVSGSAACPVKLFKQWQALTGQILLERYGMTEIGMAISNPYSGERRANVFLEYWRNPQATGTSFNQGWFCTGDIAVREGGYYRIMGRASVDIIKSGGYKLSALESEGALLSHEAIAEYAVVGLPDETWDEAVAACVVLKPGMQLDLETLKGWSAGRMSPYKIPKQLLVLEALPRNAMGKVMKPELVKLV